MATKIQNPFRFADLPPELRDRIYSFALQEQRPLKLVSGLSDTAKALSKVSRAVRSDAAKAFFAENTFEAPLYLIVNPDLSKECAKRLAKWATLLGPLASAHIRSLSLACGGPTCLQRIMIDLRNRIRPVVYGIEAHRCAISAWIWKCDMKGLVLALLCGRAGEGCTAEQICCFVREVQNLLSIGTGERRIARVAEVISKAA